GSVRVPHRTPPQDGHVHLGMMYGELEVGNRVVSIRGSLDSGSIDAISDHEGSERSARDDRLADDDVSPGYWEAITADADFHAVRVHRPVVPALDVILARPDQFHRSAARAFRVLRHEPVARANAIDRRLITTGDRNVAGRAGELLIRRPQLRRVGALYSREIPFHSQRIARLLRGPELVGDNGDRCSSTYSRNLE